MCKIKVSMKRNFLLSNSKELWEWWGVAFVLLWWHSRLPSYSRFWFMQIRWLVTSQSGVKSQKIEYLSQLFCIELKLSTVVTLITKLHDIFILTFPWQHNGLRALSIQRGKSKFPSSRKVIFYCCSFSECQQIWTLHSTSTRRSVKLWSNK